MSSTKKSRKKTPGDPLQDKIPQYAKDAIAGLFEDNTPQYARDVLTGKIKACKWVKLAVIRHYRDLEEGPARGIYFDEFAADHAVKFYGFLTLSHGEFSGVPFKLSPWQEFITWVVFGWMNIDGTRRFRTSYLEVARKNGKSTWAAGTGLYFLDADGEPGAEVYSAATKRDQAKIVWTEAKRMVRKSPSLKKSLSYSKNGSIFCEETDSKFEPLGRDSNSLDGLNIHAAIIDELHAHKSRDLYEVIDTATGSRRQPMIWSITTAGVNQQGICREMHDYTERILEGVFEDDTFFGIIYTLDDPEEWQDEENWIKANPNLGISAKIEDLRRLATKAKNSPASLNGFLRLRMNVWTQQQDRYIDLAEWDLCSTRPPNKPYDVWLEEMLDKVRGKQAVAGLDLSSTEDITALVLLFRHPEIEDGYLVVPRMWLPEDTISKRVSENNLPYDVWVREELLFDTPGKRVDYNFIQEDLLKFRERFDIPEIAYDPYNAMQCVNNLLDEGFCMIMHRQGYLSMSPPMKQMNILIGQGKLDHGGHKVLRWMADNLAADMDPAGNFKPAKDKSAEKIDGIVALIMAISRAIVADMEDDYDGVKVI